MTAGPPERNASMHRALGAGAAQSPAAPMPAVRLIADLVCPWCYIGFHRLQRLIERRPAVLVWQPFLLNPHLPAEGVPRRQYLERRFGSLGQAQGLHRRAAEIAALDGLRLSVGAITDQPNTLLAHGLALTAADHGLLLPAVEALFRAFFVENLDIGDAATLERVAGKIGLPLAAREPDAWEARRGEVLAAHGQARVLGISGVPAMLFGADHLIAGAQPAEVLAALLDMERFRQSRD